MLKIIYPILLATLASQLIAFSVYAQEINATREANAGPRLNMQLNVEVIGIEQAALQSAQALDSIAESINHLATNPELTPQQQQQFEDTLLAVTQLSTQLNSSLQQLPNTVSQSTQPIVELADDLSNKIQLWVLIILAALVVLIIVALLAIYFSVLAPTSRAVITATSQLNQLASSLKTTAQLVEQTTAQNQVLLMRLDKTKPQSFAQKIKRHE
ncbi:hypothetical protein M0C34_19365 [Agarivorans sp. TSD2052]|uniref:hypothetical protein n=1 Tax=Agarivorans sp. TSD2052 TaxID=2937286 RepID=UPI00200DF845|nr:hypothetical protein [Agarivorans sp. TSD2052]UPW18357.1 hypothetical protein M0C34_19365 [Agarivorans sp. TSD2052]